MLRILSFGLALMLAPGLAQAQGAISEVERCQVIAQEMVDYNDQSRIMFERFCETLFLDVPATNEPEPSALHEPPVAVLPGGKSEYFVKCVVADDPDYIGFRLVTRSQCDAMKGQVTQASGQADRQLLRDFAPKPAND